jgi:hypothetical protein
MESAYCVKCKKQHIMNGAKKVKTKNGRHAIKGSCSVCGTKMYKFVA